MHTKFLQAIAVFGVLAAHVLGHESSFAAEDDKDGKTQRDALLETFVSELVDVTPGSGDFPQSFQMGSGEGADALRPAHRVRFDYEFAIARYEVPQNLYTAVMGDNPSRWTGPRNSAERMSWDDAGEFCGRLTRLLRTAGHIEQDELIRLPSEAEWEYCCRAGTSTAYSFGNQAQADGDEGKQATLLDAYGWHTGNAAGNDPPVGALKPNAWGLYDMHGYLWEFVADAWHDNYIGAPGDGRAWGEVNPDAPRVVRGGSWRETHDKLRSSSRLRLERKLQRDDIGFRCVKARAHSGGSS